jgi:hypothetical protein
MKLRIFGNSLRLRLSQSEVTALAASGKVEDRISFGKSAGQSLTYTLLTADVPNISASFDNGAIRVDVPRDLARNWAGSDEVSLKAEQPLDSGDSLKILIEKDFKCLTPRDEDESDNFPNPNKSC